MEWKFVHLILEWSTHLDDNFVHKFGINSLRLHSMFVATVKPTKSSTQLMWATMCKVHRDAKIKKAWS